MVLAPQYMIRAPFMRVIVEVPLLISAMTFLPIVVNRGMVFWTAWSSWGEVKRTCCGSPEGRGGSLKARSRSLAIAA